MIQLVEVGHSYKVHGIKGELNLSIDPKFLKHVLKEEVLFFNIDGNDIPYFIEACTAKSDILCVKFHEVDNPEVARILSNQIVYADKSRLKNYKSKEIKVEPVIKDFVNFIISDQNSGIQTQIASMEEFPSQWMAMTILDGKEILIPMREEWIIEIIESKKLIIMNLPQGIFEL